MRKSKRIFVLAVLLFCFLSFPGSQVFAAPDMAEVPLTVKQSFVVKNPAKEMDFTGNYEFRASDKEAPMPKGAKDGVYSFSLNGEQTETTIYLQYSHKGVYRYRLIQTTKDRELYQYDRSCYEISVHIKDGENGKMIFQVVAEKGDGKKSGELEFRNSYQGNAPGDSEPSNPSDYDEQNEPVKTGDTTPIMVYVLLAAGALLLIAVLAYFRKHRQKK
ncbi:MAG: FctA domain-containing protein [Blautia sp.]|mgnify:CR=1 FL=1|nr:FctA domain-containing protein [Blautia sp.]